ncbi:hypothetical protein AAVH_40062 [Aphelenchoides avenae]|nr:hypothetical protein AAVH_40062 [Aphelenchus avenae]
MKAYLKKATSLFVVEKDVDEMELAASLVMDMIYSRHPQMPCVLRHVGELLVKTSLVERIVQRFRSLKAHDRLFLSSLRMETHHSPVSRDNKELERIWPDAHERNVRPCRRCSGKAHNLRESGGFNRGLRGECFHFYNEAIRTQLTVELLRYDDELEWVQAVQLIFSNSKCTAFREELHHKRSLP